MPSLQEIGQALGQTLQDFGGKTAAAAREANAVSRQAQSAQAAFNSQTMNQANSITDNRIASQYGFNSGMMAAANTYNSQAWERAAEWNEMMWQKQADFNSAEAQKNRDWQTQMANTQYQRAMADMEKAGLNPILASGGISGGVPSGSTASVGGAQMSSAQSQMASGGLLGAESASISNYTGQMETLTGILGLMAAMAAASSSGQNAFITLVDGLSEQADNMMSEGMESEAKQIKSSVDKITSGEGDIGDVLDLYFNHRPGSMAMKGLADLLPDEWNPWKKPESGGRGKTNRVDAAQYSRNMSQYKSWEKYSKPKG